MKDRYQDLLQILKDHTSISSANIALKMNVSSRSVKAYIKDLNLQYPNLILSSKKGYCLNTNKKIDATWETQTYAIPQNQQERIRYIIKMILKNEASNTPLMIYDLADSIYVSIATIRRDLQEAMKLCREYHTTLIVKNDQLQIEGREQHKRGLMGHLYMLELAHCNMDEDEMQRLFSDYDVQTIKDIISQTCLKHHYRVNGYAINNIVLDTLIAIDRISHSLLSDTPEKKITLNYHEIELAKEIVSSFEKLYHITYGKEELISFTTLLFSHLLRVDYQEMTLQDLKKIVGEEAYHLAEDIIKETDDYFLKDRSIDFFKRFTLHLSNLLLRTRTNHINNNLLTDTIKNTCPLLFDCAVNISNIIYRKTGYIINDDEIAYIAIHIGTLAGEEQVHHIRCAFLHHDYYDITDILHKKLKERFIHVDFIPFTSISDIKEDEFDLILTTYPCAGPAQEKTIVITNLCTEKDMLTISKKLEEIEANKQKIRLINELLSVTNPEFFYHNPACTSREELIHDMVEDLHKNGYVHDTYEHDVLYREHISSTCFNLIAVPHSLKMNAATTMISIAMFDKPLPWGKKKVHIVFLFAIQESDIQLFHDIFDHLITLLIDEQNVYQILKSAGYGEFVERLSHIL